MGVALNLQIASVTMVFISLLPTQENERFFYLQVSSSILLRNYWQFIPTCREAFFLKDVVYGRLTML